MGLVQRDRSRDGRREWDQPCRLAPRFRYRVVLSGMDGNAAVAGDDCRPVRALQPQVVWVTNDLSYARSLAAQLNSLVTEPCAGVDAWNRAEIASQSRWIRLKREPR